MIGSSAKVERVHDVSWSMNLYMYVCTCIRIWCYFATIEREKEREGESTYITLYICIYAYSLVQGNERALTPGGLDLVLPPPLGYNIPSPFSALFFFTRLHVFPFAVRPFALLSFIFHPTYMVVLTYCFV